MTSRLASALIALPRPEGVVSDLLWRHADLLNVTTAGAVPSVPLVTELATLTGNAAALAVGKLLPTPSTCAAALSCGSAKLRNGLAENPAASLDVLRGVVKKKGVAADVAQARLDMIDAAISSARSGADLTEPLKNPDVAMAEAFDGAGLREQWAHGVLAAGSGGAHFRCYRIAAPELADVIAHAVISTGRTVDAAVAEWVLHPRTTVAETLQSLLASSVTLERRLTSTARRMFVQAGLLAERRAQTPPAAVSAEMIATLRLIGRSPLECAALVLNNDAVTLDCDLVVGLLTESSDGMVAQFCAGASQRRPRPGEITELFARLDAERIARVVEMVGDAVDYVAWAPELLLSYPRRSLDKLNETALAELDTVISERLGDIEARWDFCLVMSEEWEQSLDTLLDAALRMDTLTAIDTVNTGA